MLAVAFDAFGPPERLRPVEVDDPGPPGPGQVLVEVRAAGVNFHDHRQRAGLSTEARLPGIPGLEMAGVVRRTGTGVARFAPGERVFGRARRSYAELVLAQADDLFHVPERLSFAEAAVVPVGFLTATHALRHKAGLRPGERLLVQAAGSSVGSAAVLLAKRWGAWVVGTAGTPERCRRVVDRLGADEAVDYRRPDPAARVRALTGGDGVDVVLDGLGSATFDATVDALAMGGRALVYGAASGSEEVTLSLARLMNRGAAVIGFSIVAEREVFARTMATFRTEVLPLLADGRLRPVLDRTVPLAAAAEAHRSIVQRRHFGKLALVP